MPIDDYSGDAPDQPVIVPTSPGKYIKIWVPDFMNTGDPLTAMGSYLRLGAVENPATAGMPPAKVAAATPPAPPTPQPTVGALAPGSQGPPTPSSPIVPVPPDPSGEDLASLVQGFADDTRNRGVFGQPDGDMQTHSSLVNEGADPNYPQSITTADTTRVPARVQGGVLADPTKPPPATFDPTDYRAIESSLLHTKGGWRDHSDGNRITTTRGDKVEVVRGNYKLIVIGRQDESAQKFQGTDISGGSTDSGDLTADASTDQSPWTTSFSTLTEYKMVPPDTQYRTYATAKTGSAPKVATKPSSASEGVPAVVPDGRAFKLPISGSISIKETWGFVQFNYTGIGYARAPEWQTPPSATSPGTLAPVADPDADASLNPPGADYFIYPIAKNVTKNYVWDQTSETYANTTWTLTAGPRTTDATGASAFPTGTTPAGAPYDPVIPVEIKGSGYAPLEIPPVTMPGTNVDQGGPGKYNKVASITTETHVEEQKSFTVAGTTYSQTGTPGDHVKTQHTVTYADHSRTETHVGAQHNTSHIGTSEVENFTGAQNTFNTVGAQSTINTIGAQSTITNAGVSAQVTAAGVSAAVQVNLLAMTLKYTLMDLTYSYIANQVQIANGVKTKIHNGAKVEADNGAKVATTTTHITLDATTIELKTPAGSLKISTMHILM